MGMGMGGRLTPPFPLSFEPCAWVQSAILGDGGCPHHFRVSLHSGGSPRGLAILCVAVIYHYFLSVAVLLVSKLLFLHLSNSISFLIGGKGLFEPLRGDNSFQSAVL